MAIIALLLAEDSNAYQQTLATEARSAASKAGLILLAPKSAGGLSMTQGQQMFECLRNTPLPDAMLVVPVVADTLRQAATLVLKRGVGLVFLNRVPSFMQELRQEFPNTLLTSVAPDQHQIGVIQGQQCLAIAPAARIGLLVTGSLRGPSAADRKRGLLEVLGGRVTFDEVEGHWTAEEAEKEVALWLRIGATLRESIDLVVCQNDDMAVGVRTAFRAAGRPMPPAVGCDGLPGLGQQMVGRGELTATVVMPTTSTRAVDIVVRALKEKSWPESTVLAPTSFPTVESLAKG
jgi:ABC-type sugar transport system substrate-binding protein